MTAAPPRRLVVRTAEERDVSRVTSIEAASFADPWTADSFRTSLTLPHIRFLVAEWVGEDGSGGTPVAGAPAVVGYVLAMVLGPEGEIADIAVAPEVRGQGIGGVLLDAMTAGLRGCGVRTVYLEVRESNVTAQRLYETRSFAHVGRRRGYYQQPSEDALVLRREFGTT